MPIDAPTIDVLRKQAIAMAMLWLTARDYDHEGGRAWFHVRARDLGLRDDVLPGKRIRITIDAEADESGVSASDGPILSASAAPTQPPEPAKLDADRKDALRYRWLRGIDNDVCVVMNDGVPHTEELDAAIDAAMADKGNQP